MKNKLRSETRYFKHNCDCCQYHGATIENGRRYDVYSHGTEILVRFGDTATAMTKWSVDLLDRLPNLNEIPTAIAGAYISIKFNQ